MVVIPSLLVTSDKSMARSTHRPKPFPEYVRFGVTFDCVDHDGYWVARTVETGVVGGWFTHEKAEDEAALANLALVRVVKQDGQAALDRFFAGNGMEYEAVSQSEPEQTVDGERRILIA